MSVRSDRRQPASLLDTSLLVAAIVRDHPNHSRALPWLQRAKGGKFPLVLASHTLAELYAVLTTLPVTPRISPAMAQSLIEQNTSCAKVVSLTPAAYRAVLKRTAALGLGGGVIYDALICEAARKGRAEQIVTFNDADFLRLWQEGDPSIVLP
jgi:predicted nucleic acid-binding protein